MARTPSAPRPTPPARRPAGGTGTEAGGAAAASTGRGGGRGGGRGRAKGEQGRDVGPAGKVSTTKVSTTKVSPKKVSTTKGAAGPDPAGGSGTPGAAPSDDEFTRPYLLAAYAFLLLAGIGFGVVGAFLVPAGPRIGAVLLSYGVAVGLVGNAGLSLLGLWLTRTRMGALLLLLGWGPVVIWLGTRRTEGDLILTGRAEAYVFLFAGALAPVAVAVLGRPTRGVTGMPAPPPRRAPSTRR